MLQMHDPTKLQQVGTDALDYALGATLEQQGNNKK